MDENTRTTSYIDQNGNKKTGVTAMPDYNPGTDYQSLIDQAAGKKDYAAAGYYEQQRAKKIAGQGLAYQPTEKYKDFYGQVDPVRAASLEQGYTTIYDPNADYSSYIKKAADAKDFEAAGYYEQLRRMKIEGEGLPYAPTSDYAAYYGKVTPERALELRGGYQAPAAQQTETTDYLDAILQNLERTYQRQIAENDQVSAAQTAMQMEALERQRQKQADEFRNLNRQLYVDTRQNERRLPEQLAAMGYTGGASETAMLRNRLTYEQALRDNEAARISGEQDIDFQGRQIQQQEELARRQAAMQLLGEYQSGVNSVLGQKQDQANYEREQARSQANYEREQDLKLRQTAIAYATAAADNMAQYGDFSGYALVTDLNGNRLYSDEQIAAMKARYDAMVAAQSFSSGGSGGGRGSGGRRGSGYSSSGSDGYEGQTMADGNWIGSNKPHEDIDYSNGKAVEHAVAAANTINKLMADGRSKDYVKSVLDDYYNNGYISDDAYRRLKAANSARNNSGTGARGGGGGGGKQATTMTK